MPNPLKFLSPLEERVLQEKLLKEYLSGTWTTYHQAALRHGIPDSVIGKVMRKMKLALDDTIKNQRDEELTRTLLQIEATIGKANEAFERSRARRKTCGTCKGLGENVDGDECMVCNGDGYMEMVVSGDSKLLLVVLKALEQKARIYGMYPEKPIKIKQQVNVLQGGEVIGEQNTLLGASTELLLQFNRLMLEVKAEKVNWEDEEVLDVESKEKDNKG